MRTLIGRRAELEALSRSIAAAGEGRGSTTILVGEPGIGKSRLSREAVELARGVGVASYCGRCWESGGQPAYWPWIQILRALVRDRSAEALERDVGSAGGEVARLIPELRDRVANLTTLPELAGSDARFRLFDALSSFLFAAARRAPVLVVLEDLHAADRASVELLDFIARSVDSEPIALVGTYREVDARIAGLSDLLCKTQRSALTLRLEPLSAEEVAELVRGLTGARPPASVLERLCDTTEGNPLFIEELMRQGTPATLPEGIAAVIRERLSGLPAETLSVLQDASVLGRELDAHLLSVAMERPVPTIHDALQPALETEILSASDPEHYVFRHILVRESLYRDLPPPRRFALHRAVARTLRSQPPGARRHTEIAHHYDQAGPEAIDESIAAHRAAAERADSLYAYGEAASLLEHAYELLLQAAPDDEFARCELLIDLGRARVRSGDAAPAKEACREAATLARGLGESALFARAALVYGSVYTLARTDDRLVALLEEALQKLRPGQERLRALCTARLAAALQPAPDPAGPIAMAREAISMARAAGDAPTLLATLRNAASAMMDLEEPRLRVEVNREHVQLATSLGDITETLRGRARLVFDFAEMGEVSSADAMVEAYAREAAEVSHPLYEWQAVTLRAMRLIMRGEHEEAGRLNARAMALAAKLPDTGLRFYTEVQRLGLARARYDDELLRELLVSSSVLAAIPGDASRVLVASLHAHLEDHAQVATMLKGCDTDAVLRRDDPHLLTCLAEIAFALGDAELAAATGRRLVPKAHRNASWGLVGLICDSPLERALALCHAARGERAQASRHFEEAARRAAAMRAPGFSARIHYEHARSLLRLGGDPAHADALLVEARKLAMSCGMPGLGKRIDERTPSRSLIPARQDPEELSIERDGETWRIEFRGQALRLEDSKGLRIIARLVAEPGRELHVLDLASGGRAVDSDDAGALLDEEAIAAYRTRAAELREQLDESETWNDVARVEQARRELDMLTTELSRAVGLGSRRRTAGAAAERARVNVRKRVRHALRRIGAQDPMLGKYLEQTVRTGAFCRYEPI